jgi:hypothetical protein
VGVRREELYEVKRQLEAADVELRAQIVSVETRLRQEFTDAFEGLRHGIAAVEDHLNSQDARFDGRLDSLTQALMAWTAGLKTAGRWSATVAATITAFSVLHFGFHIG